MGDIDKNWVTQKEVLDLIGINYRTFQKWTVPVKTTKGRAKYYSWPDILQAHHEYRLQQRLTPVSEHDDGTGEVELDLFQEQAKKVRADRVGREIKNAELMRELAPVEMLVRALTSVNGAVSAILTSLPLNIKRRHPEVGTAIIREIEREIVKAQNQMVDVKLEWGED